MSAGASRRDTLDIPIRDGLVIRIWGIPHDLTRAEAGRVAGVIQALAEPAPGVRAVELMALDQMTAEQHQECGCAACRRRLSAERP